MLKNVQKTNQLCAKWFGGELNCTMGKNASTFWAGLVFRILSIREEVLKTISLVTPNRSEHGPANIMPKTK